MATSTFDITFNTYINATADAATSAIIYDFKEPCPEIFKMYDDKYISTDNDGSAYLEYESFKIDVRSMATALAINYGIASLDGLNKLFNLFDESAPFANYYGNIDFGQYFPEYDSFAWYTDSHYPGTSS